MAQKQMKHKNHWDRRKVMTACLAGFMVLLMVLPMIATVVTWVGATSSTDLQAEINASRAEASELESQISALGDRLDSLRASKADAIAEKELLEQQIDVQRYAIAQVTAIIEQYDRLIAEKEEDIANTEEKEAIQFELFCRRVRAMEEEGDATYWDILFSAADFSDLIDRIVFINDIMLADNAIIDQLVETRLNMETQKVELEQTRLEQQAEKETLEAHEAALLADEATIAKLIASIAADERAVEAAEAALQAEADRVNNLIRTKQLELAALISSGQVSFDASTGWQWPLSNNYQITSLFANRIHPITGTYGQHTGTDIAAPGGTPILAAANGVVLLSTYGSAYGNYVVIEHHNGIQTLYAHMQSRAVEEGQVVFQGQVIGYVGTTGSSTGNHLHLEFRVNGVRQDALSYYPSIKFDLSRA